MLYPTAGSRLYIADEPNGLVEPGLADLPSGGWVEITEFEALGILGGEWSLAEAEFARLDDGPEGGRIFQAKQSLRRLPMQIIIGLDPESAGQNLLWEAYRVTSTYPFRIVLPGTSATREWWGAVVSLSEVFDTANNVMRLQADVLPVSETRRA